jgi:uncharacterized protein YxjI
MDLPEGTEAYMIQQKKEWGEILTSIETKNKYVVKDLGGQELFYAAEVGGSTLGRLVLRSMRSFTIDVLRTDGSVAFRLVRPFRIYFHKVDMFDASGARLGTIQRRWSLLRRIYSVLDAGGSQAFQLFGPLLHPWTFQIRRDGHEVGRITKKWSGLFKEAFTAADNFGVTFPSSLELPHKALLLGAVFLIDFVHFEERSS